MAMKKIGGAWVRDKKGGGKFFSCQLDMDLVTQHQGKFNFMIFRNEKATGKQPEYNIMVIDDTPEPPAMPIEGEGDTPF